MSSYFFTIEGDRIAGKYIVLEWNKGIPKNIMEISGKNYGGLKEARQIIGEYLRKKGHPLDKVIKHQTIKPGRKNNPIHEWTIEEYLIGVPLRSKRTLW